MTHLIKSTYEVVTPESAAEGDVADAGWLDEEGVNMDEEGEWYADEAAEAGMSPVVFATVKHLQDAGAVDCSSSRWRPGSWWSDYGEDVDYRTGASTRCSYHLVGYTDSEQAEVARMLGARM